MRDMTSSVMMRFSKSFLVMVVAGLALASRPLDAQSQSRLSTAHTLRCTFPILANGTWKPDGAPQGTITSAKLVLIFDEINIDEGTARLRSGSSGAEIAVKFVGGYLNFMQAFRTGPLYTTTVFDKETTAGRFKAVHSRHEYFSTPLPGATSNPEQYYGECEVQK
jgi:hypothetical protein